MTAKEHYNGIVVDAGQAGGPLSTALAGAGWKIALIRLGLSFEPPFEREYWICLVEG
jgi:choline dehydrogenase-like flavoprotein